MAVKSPLIPVEPAVLRWARETAGYDVDEAAKKAGISKPEKLMAIEAGEKLPSIAQMRKLAHAYGRALAVMFSPAVPEEPPIPPDFRVVQGQHRLRSPEVLLTVRKMQAYQAEAAELVEEDPEHPTIELPKTSADAEASAANVRFWLGVSTSDLARARGDKALRYWRDLAEQKRLLTMGFAGVPVESLRGLSLPHPRAPLVAYNMKDSSGARLFSLLHEIAHLSRREAGLCLAQDDVKVEAWCNAVAGNALVPKGELMAEPERSLAATGDDGALSRIANRYGVSREVVLRRLVEIGLATKATYASARARWQSQYGDRLEAEVEHGEGGPTYYRAQVARLGRRYVQLVIGAMESGNLTTNSACSLLAVKVQGLDMIQREAWS